MTGWFGSRFFVIPNQVLNLFQDLRFRDLCFWFRIWVLKPLLVVGVLYLVIGAWKLVIEL
jgi:hypothetical protein